MDLPRSVMAYAKTSPRKTLMDILQYGFKRRREQFDLLREEFRKRNQQPRTRQ